MSVELCGELSPDGRFACVIPKFAHSSWGAEHSWERCTSRLVAGFPQTRCCFQPGHTGAHGGRNWPNLGEHEGLAI